MTSPACTVKDGAGSPQVTPPYATATPANVITIQLADTAGVDAWELTCTNTDEQHVPATVQGLLSVNPSTKTATFTAPSGAWSFIFQSRVNGGNDVNGQADRSLTTTFKVAAATNDGKILVAANETLEHHPTFGWVGSLNDAIRNQASGSLPTSSGDDYAPLVEYPAGTPLWLPSDGTPGKLMVQTATGWERRLIDVNDLGTPFAISSFTKTNPGGSILLLERGDTLTGLTATSAYGAGPPDSASVARALGGSASGDVDTLAWAAGIGPGYTAWSTTGSLKRNGSGSSDPTLINTLSATKGATTKQSAFTIAWTRRMRWGVAVSGSGVDQTFIDANLTNTSLQQTSSWTGRSAAYGGVTKYLYWSGPQDYGALVGRLTSNGSQIPASIVATVSYTNAFGVTWNERLYRSDNPYNVDFGFYLGAS